MCIGASSSLCKSSNIFVPDTRARAHRVAAGEHDSTVGQAPNLTGLQQNLRQQGEVYHTTYYVNEKASLSSASCHDVGLQTVGMDT